MSNSVRAKTRRSNRSKSTKTQRDIRSKQTFAGQKGEVKRLNPEQINRGARLERMIAMVKSEAGL